MLVQHQRNVAIGWFL